MSLDLWLGAVVCNRGSGNGEKKKRGATREAVSTHSTGLTLKLAKKRCTLQIVCRDVYAAAAPHPDTDAAGSAPEQGGSK